MIKKVLIILAGAVTGYLYYRFIGCNSGACPITSNPYISVIAGGLIASMFIIPDKKKEPTK